MPAQPSETSQRCYQAFLFHEDPFRLYHHILAKWSACKNISYMLNNNSLLAPVVTNQLVEMLNGETLPLCGIGIMDTSWYSMSSTMGHLHDAVVGGVCTSSFNGEEADKPRRLAIAASYRGYRLAQDPNFSFLYKPGVWETVKEAEGRNTHKKIRSNLKVELGAQSKEGGLVYLIDAVRDLWEPAYRLLNE